MHLCSGDFLVTAKAVEYKTEKISLVAASPEDQTPNSTTLEVSPRQIKKEKYKRLYQEEKNKGEMMQNHYYEQLSRKDAEIDKVRKTAAEQREIFEQQIRILEVRTSALFSLPDLCDEG